MRGTANSQELGLLRHAWEADADALRAVVAFRARAMSDRAMELSGLLEAASRDTEIAR